MIEANIPLNLFKDDEFRPNNIGVETLNNHAKIILSNNDSYNKEQDLHLYGINKYFFPNHSIKKMIKKDVSIIVCFEKDKTLRQQLYYFDDIVIKDTNLGYPKKVSIYNANGKIYHDKPIYTKSKNVRLVVVEKGTTLLIETETTSGKKYKVIMKDFAIINNPLGSNI